MRVNEIFYSIQGEGRWTGTPAVFVRLSGCNLRCEFCDTDHSGFSELSEEQIVEQVMRYPARHVVITGGEPGLQLTSSLVEKLHAAGRFVQVETNGTMQLPDGVDWITCSPKGVKPALKRVNELKVLMTVNGPLMEGAEDMEATVRSLQPCDTSSSEDNRRTLAAAIDYVLTHPEWHLSLQTHKLIDIK